MFQNDNYKRFLLYEEPKSIITTSKTEISNISNNPSTVDSYDDEDIRKSKKSSK
jgi:hypothetical protein